MTRVVGTPDVVGPAGTSVFLVPALAASEVLCLLVLTLRVWSLVLRLARASVAQT